MTTLMLVPQPTVDVSPDDEYQCPAASWCVVDHRVNPDTDEDAHSGDDNPDTDEVTHRVDPDTRTVTHRGDVGQPIEGTDMTASLFRVDESGQVGETFIDWRGPDGDLQVSLESARRFVNRTVFLTHSVEPVDLGDVLRDFRGGAA